MYMSRKMYGNDGEGDDGGDVKGKLGEELYQCMVNGRDKMEFCVSHDYV